MQFVPKSEKEIQEAGLWPKGEYDFEVIKSEPAKSGPNSKTPGTPFIKLNVQLWDKEGRTRFVNGILHPAMEAQLRHFCVVGNKMAQYEAGTLTADDCLGVTGRLKLRQKEAEGNYPAKNEIQDFVVPKEKTESASPEPATQEAEDSCPF